MKTYAWSYNKQYRYILTISRAVEGHPGFRELTQELKVFKKAYSRDVQNYPYNKGKDCIVNMIIPVGAIVYLGSPKTRKQDNAENRKMRANVAFVHSIASGIADQCGNFGTVLPGRGGAISEFIPTPISNQPGVYAKNTSLKRAYSGYTFSQTLVYKVGKIVKPVDESFSMRNNQCEAGIHFFMNLKDAMKY